MSNTKSLPAWPGVPPILPEGWSWTPDRSDGRWVALRRVERPDGDDVFVRVHEGSCPPDGTLRITVRTAELLPSDTPPAVALGPHASVPAEVYAAVARANELLDAYDAARAHLDGSVDAVELVREVRDLCADRVHICKYDSPLHARADLVALDADKLLAQARERLLARGHVLGATCYSGEDGPTC